MEDLNMKVRSKFNHDLTNLDFLHCVILRTYKASDMQFFLETVQNEIFKILKMFKYNMKFTRATC